VTKVEYGHDTIEFIALQNDCKASALFLFSRIDFSQHGVFIASSLLAVCFSRMTKIDEVFEKAIAK